MSCGIADVCQAGPAGSAHVAALRRFNSVERILEYNQLPQEKARDIPDMSPPPAWPTKGVIQYQDVWMRYREGLDPVLKVLHPAALKALTPCHDHTCSSQHGWPVDSPIIVLQLINTIRSCGVNASGPDLQRRSILAEPEANH